MAPPPRAANHDRRAGTWAERGATRREILGADGAVHARFTATAWASTDGRGAEKEQILPGEAGGREAVRGRRLEVEGAGAMRGSHRQEGARATFPPLRVRLLRGDLVSLLGVSALGGPTCGHRGTDDMWREGLARATDAERQDDICGAWTRARAVRARERGWGVHPETRVSEWRGGRGFVLVRLAGGRSL